MRSLLRCSRVCSSPTPTPPFRTSTNSARRLFNPVHGASMSDAPASSARPSAAPLTPSEATAAARRLCGVWFGEMQPADYWKKDPELDERLRREFGDFHERLVLRGRGGTPPVADDARPVHTEWAWDEWPPALDEGGDDQNGSELLLGAILALDQIPRNIYRDTPRMFAADDLAVALAARVCAVNADTGEPSTSQLTPALHASLPFIRAQFAVLPFEHSESLAHQRVSKRLMREIAERFSDNNAGAFLVKFADDHHDIVERFGRFPHRNAVLGRPSTEAEEQFLRDEHSGF
jgi:uncharacterized protein (DUF924 family)